MYSENRCDVCRRVMMVAITPNGTMYQCVTQHEAEPIGKASTVHLSENLAELGPNVDLLMEYLKRP